MSRSSTSIRTKRTQLIIGFLLVIALTITGCGGQAQGTGEQGEAQRNGGKVAQPLRIDGEGVSVKSLPQYAQEPYIILNDNQPEFGAGELGSTAYEQYSELDSLGRCGPAVACIGKEIMPTQKRGSIGQVKPSGWKTVKYDTVDGKYLYNRCHLIGYQLTGENANEKNLITGTRYLNVEGMLPFEDMIADYVKETGNHVLYRVTPVFEGNNLVASGVQMEARSIEDNGEGILFNVYAYNDQPGITIDYATGESHLATGSENGATGSVSESGTTATVGTFILNRNTKKFHRPTCSSVKAMKEENKEERTQDSGTLASEGYAPCKNCNP